MQDAAIKHNEAMAEREADQDASEQQVQQGSEDAANMTKGSLPNLEFGLLGRAALEQHCRFVPLPPLPQLPAEQPIPDSLLPLIPQGNQ